MLGLVVMRGGGEGVGGELLTGDFDIGPVHSELEADAQVVLHAADLSAERDLFLGEGVGGGLELIAIHLHLIAQAREVALRLPGDERVGLADMDSLLAEHGGEDRAHGVLGLVAGHDADAISVVVDVEEYAWDIAESAMVVLGLIAQVALHIDGDARERAVEVGPDAPDMFADQLELAVGVCGWGGASLDNRSSLIPLRKEKKIPSLSPHTFARRQDLQPNDLPRPAVQRPLPRRHPAHVCHCARLIGSTARRAMASRSA